MKKVLKLIITTLILCASTFAIADVAKSPVGKTAIVNQANLPDMLKRVMPAIVNISVMGEVSMMVDPSSLRANNPGGDMDVDPNGPMPDSSGLLPIKKKFASLGSGVIVDAAKGYVITNAHVVKDAKFVTVTLNDGRKFVAKPIGADEQSDLAVLQIKPDKLTSIEFADSDELKVGQPVFAIGNPFGIGQTVTSGIISGLGRSNLHIENFEDFIQTDASINPGNSGGALVNTKGEMIGVNTAILAPTGGNVGIGFAIPSNMAHSVMMQLIRYGAIHRGLMGVVVNDIGPDLAQIFHVTEDSGAVISMVTPNSPAAKAGLKVSDIITSINGQKIKNAADLRNYVGLQQVGAALTVSYLHGGKPLSITLKTADPAAYQQEAENTDPFLYGLDLQQFDAQTVAAGRVKGVLVVRAEPDSAAWRSGIRSGDVILSANQKGVSNIDELLAASKLDSQKLLLNIFRLQNNAATFVVVQ